MLVHSVHCYIQCTKLSKYNNNKYYNITVLIEKITQDMHDKYRLCLSWCSPNHFSCANETFLTVLNSMLTCTNFLIVVTPNEVTTCPDPSVVWNACTCDECNNRDVDDP